MTTEKRQAAGGPAHGAAKWFHVDAAKESWQEPFERRESRDNNRVVDVTIALQVAGNPAQDGVPF